MRQALVMLAVLIRRASTLLPPAAPTRRSARFATDASRALEQRFDAALKDDCGVRANDTVVAAVSGGGASVSGGASADMEFSQLSAL